MAEPSFSVPLFRVFLQRTLNCNDSKTLTSALNYVALRFSSVKCSYPVLPKEITNEDLTVVCSTEVKNEGTNLVCEPK